MNEHPILFSTTMVQANLEGRKTITRRMTGLDEVNGDPDSVEFLRFQQYKDGRYRAIFQHKLADEPGSVKCPYGQQGDLLWVRETWCPTFGEYLHKESNLPFMFKADVKEPYPGFEKAEMAKYGFRWRPSIHMPKAAARIWLQVEEISVERLQEISQQDAIDEGMKFHRLFGEWGGVVKHPKVKDHFNWYSNPVDAFKNLWITINGMESYKSNPWVWVVKYKVLSTTGKPEINPSVIKSFNQ